MNRPEATVLILTLNGERYLDEVLAAVSAQVTAFPFEVLVIDSGSKDGTKAILNAYQDKSVPVRVIEIDKDDFNHGGTRNLGIKEARGEYVALLTQDATPASDHWLQALRDCFDISEDVAAAFGKHLPREDANPITRRDIEGVFLNISPDGTQVVQSAPPEDREALATQGFSPLTFYSDVNSAVRKMYWQEHPYREADYAEDQIFGRDVLAAGFKKVYCPDAAVYHSHEYRPDEFLKRYYDEYRGLEKTVGYKEPLTLFGIVPSALKGAVRDYRMIAESGQSGAKGSVGWAYFSWRMNWARMLGAYFGARHETLPGWIKRRLSKEGHGV